MQKQNLSSNSCRGGSRLYRPYVVFSLPLRHSREMHSEIMCLASNDALFCVVSRKFCINLFVVCA